jgi:hypothetical protein
VHFDDEQELEANTVNTGRQQQRETNSQSESSEGTALEDDELEILKQQLAVKNYNEKVLKEQLAIKERELAEVDLRNRQLIFKLDKEKNENLKLSGELRRKSVTSGSANPDPNARPLCKLLETQESFLGLPQERVGISNLNNLELIEKQENLGFSQI